MRYEVQKWDGTAWSTVKVVQGHTMKNAIERSGVTGKVRAVDAADHWNAGPTARMVKPDNDPAIPPTGPRPLPGRKRPTAQDRFNRSCGGPRTMKHVVLSHAPVIEKNYREHLDNRSNTPDRHAYRGHEGGGTLPARESCPAPSRSTPSVLRHDRENERTQF